MQEVTPRLDPYTGPPEPAGYGDGPGLDPADPLAAKNGAPGAASANEAYGAAAAADARSYDEAGASDGADPAGGNGLAGPPADAGILTLLGAGPSPGRVDADDDAYSRLIGFDGNAPEADTPAAGAGAATNPTADGEQPAAGAGDPSGETRDDPHGAAAPGAQPEDGLGELRELLLGPERRDLSSLHRRVEDPDSRAADLAEVLPEAISRREKPDKRLAAALGPTMEDAFRASVRNNPKQLADAIAPALGPAIRKAITDALQKMVQSLTQAMDHSLSPRSFGWRMEAWRTGKPFAEIVLTRTLVYRVEQVFLIHRETGLLVQHVAAPSVATQDGDMISGMLTAVRDFMKDSFGNEEGDSLLETRLGDRWLWVEPGTEAVLAAVIWGTPPRELQARLADVISTIHLQQGADLHAFAGDVAPFEQSRPLLEQCLAQAAQAEDAGAAAGAGKKLRRRVKLAAAAAAGVLVIAALAAWAFFSVRESRRWDRFVARVRAEPGVVVTEVRREGDGLVLAGLRDPLAGDVRMFAAPEGLDPSRVRTEFESYVSLQPPFVERRAQQILAPPPGVALTLDGGRLRASGGAPGPWAREARRLAPLIAGVAAYDDSALRNLDLDRLGPLRDSIEAVSFRFVEGAAVLNTRQDDTLRDLADRLAEFSAACGDAGVAARVRVVGTGDGPAAAAAPSEADAAKLARRRAESIRYALISSGVPPALLAATTETSTAAGAVTKPARIGPPVEPGTVGLRVLREVASSQ